MIMVNWHGEENLIPAQVYTFVDLTHLRQGHRVTAEGTGQAGHRRIATGRYAVVESYTVMNDIDDGDPESLIPPVDALSMVGRFKKEYAKGCVNPHTLSCECNCNQRPSSRNSKSKTRFSG
jgi:hypothetical protein